MEENLTVPEEVEVVAEVPAEVVAEPRPAVAITRPPATPMTLLERAIDSGAGMDQIAKFMDLYERWGANEARKAYVEAMAAFKADPPRIYKDLVNDQYDSTYTSLGNLVNTTNLSLSKHGLSAGWDVITDGQGVTVKCIITHHRGHSESCMMTAPPDVSGKKNPIQQIKSTVTYLRGLTFESVLGVASAISVLDDDGNGAEFVSEQQLGTINRLIKENKADKGLFLDYLDVPSTDQIPKKDFTKAIIALKRKTA